MTQWGAWKLIACHPLTGPCIPCSVMTRRLDGKLCLVTGANQGLGLHVSEVRDPACSSLCTCHMQSSGMFAHRIIAYSLVGVAVPSKLA